MARRHRPASATLYDFRDLDVMFHLAEAENGGVPTHDLAELMGFDAEEGGRNLGIRLGWMRRYGMVKLNERERMWQLTPGGLRVVQAHELAPALRAIEKMPNEQMVEVMAHVTSRFQRGDTMLAAMMRREFLFGTKKR